MPLPSDASLLHITRCGDVVRVTFNAPDLGIFNAEDVGGPLLALAEQPGCRELHLDLRQVQFLSSTALAKFVGLHKKLSGSGRQLILQNVAPEVYEVFMVTRLNRILHIRPNEMAEVA